MTAWPDDIAVIGGGRWARTILQVLCRLAPANTIVTAHSRHNAESMRAWAADQGLGRRLRVAADWPVPGSAKPGAAIIANAARDHEQAADRMLSAGVPTLVEKPFALSAAGAQAIADRARRSGVRVAAAHVFLFASYLERFVQLVREAGRVSALRIGWEDPAVESRYGELKTYDASLPVPADILPHVVSILGALFRGATIECGPVAVHRGGAQVDLGLAVGGVQCEVDLARDGERRRRFLEVTTGRGMISLDFSVEPGTIVHGANSMSGDPDWETAQRPLARLLATFLRWAAGGDGDSRLDPAIGIGACRIIDQAIERYRFAQAAWLDARAASGGANTDDGVAYARRELSFAR